LAAIVDTSARMNVGFYYLVGIVSWPARMVYRLRATGVQNLPPEGGFVLASNHISALDPWALGYPLWPHRRLRWMAKVELFKRWWMRTMLDAGGAFPVRRGENDQRAVVKAVEVLREGDVLVMFPEGTRRRPGRERPRPHTGAARLALAAHVPLVPAALAGTNSLRRLERWRVAYGRPVAMEDLVGLGHRRAAEIITERLMEEIAALEASIQ
jgi:1-acyl-sn-glycerol-3-phosphate acyltransferase